MKYFCKQVKNKKSVLVFIMFVCVFSTQIIKAQKDKTFLTFAVTVEKAEDDGLDGVSAKLFEKGSLLNTIVTAKDGVAVFKLNPNTEYTIEFSKDGYVSKIVSINTKVASYENQMFEVAFPILLFQPCEGLDYSVLSNPIMKLVYNDMKRDFLPERNYDNVMVAKLEQLMQDNEKCIEDKYQAIVKKADRLFTEKKYVDSRSTYMEALKKRPDDKYVIDRIKAIDKLLAEQKDNEKTYKDYITQADKQFNSKNYPLAKEFYKKAQALKPQEQYPSSQIAAIDALLAQKDKEEKDAIAKQQQQAMDAQARQAQAAKDEQTKKELAAKEEQERKAKQAQAEKAQKEQQAKDEQARKEQDAKAEQDRKTKAALEEKARLEQEAKAEQEHKAQLAKEEQERKEKLVQQEKAEQDKKAKLALEEKARLEQEAKAEQEHKAQLAKEEQARKEKLAQQEKAEQDRKLKMAQDEQAKKELAAKEEQDKKAKLALLAKEEQEKKAAQAKEEQERKEREARYADFISQGDDAFDADACGKSLQAYRNALGEKPNDQAALKKIAEAENRCKDLQAKASKDKATRDSYNAAIAEADKLLASNNQLKAKDAYQKAAQILPSESYPGQKIKEIDNYLKNQEKEAQQQYKKLLADANKAFDNENLPAAKDLFGQILRLKPDDQYSKDKLQTIESIEAEQKRLEAEKKAKQDQFNKAVAEADAAFKKPDYAAAKAAYQKALALLPSESYPKQKLGEIDNIEKEQVAQIERDYNNKIQSADKNFALKNYNQALKDYQDAQKIKPQETYPAQRIDNVNKILAEQAKSAAEQKAKQDAYNAAVAKADNLMKSTQYDQALIAYKEASSYKPDEQYPFTKIDEITNIKKQQQADEAYKKTIATANSFFDQKKYEQAKSYYSQALNIKAGDTYPTAQIAKADAAIADQIKLLADQKARQDAFDKAIADADKNYALKDYEMARTAYQTALSIFPDKPAPRQKIAEIEKILKDIKRDNEFKAIVDEANALFTAGNYDQAKAKYKTAAALKPEETLPADKMKEIDRIVAQKAAEKQKQELNEKNYNESIKKANDLFDKAQYDAAKKEYENAANMMPDETYPKQKIAKINEINKMLAKDTKPAQAKEEKPKGTGVIIADLSFKNDSERELYLKGLLVKYPPGITCEVYKESNRTVSRYVIIRENQANEFREIKYNWGGADYSRNGKPITFLYFSNQIKSREGEYYLKTDM